MGNCLLTKGKENLQVDLLWTNPDPESVYSGTLSLDYSDYPWLLVVCSSDKLSTVGTGSAYYQLETRLIDTSTKKNQYMSYMGYDGSSGLRNLTCSCNDTKSSIKVYVENGTGSILWKIYGIKSFKFIQKYVSGLPGIDTTNILKNSSSSGTDSYVATQDCWCIGTSNGGAHVYLNSIPIIWSNNSQAGCFPVKAGQTVSKEGNSTFTIYALIGE